MENKEIHIRNMVCNRCIMAVENILATLGISYLKVELGTVFLPKPLDSAEKVKLGKTLEDYGFGIIDDRRSKISEQIKAAVIRLLHDEHVRDEVQAEGHRFSLSAYISDKCHADYSLLSRIFSEMNGVSIEKYYIAQRVERVKELIAYDELSLSEIAYRLDFSSPAHLSAQFKGITGLSPREFRNLKEKPLIPIDRI